MPVSRRSFLLLSGSAVAFGAEAPQGFNSLRGFSASTAQSSSTLQQLVDGAGESAVVSGDWTLTSTVTLPHRLKSLEIAEGARLAVSGNIPALSRAGQIAVLGTMSALPAGTQRFTPSFGGVNVGDTLLLAGHDTVPNSSDKYGYLRRVTGLPGGDIELDRPIPRPIVTYPRCGRVSLAPPIRIFGKGKVFNSVPSDSTKPLIHLFAVDSVDISGIEVLNNGGPGVTVSHCWGGVVAAWIHDLLDDNQTHFGYGVNVAGATRDLRVAGSASRVRHAVTTSPGPQVEGFGNAGEPETCTFEPTAWDCTDKAIDTHRAGWGITIVPKVTGGRGGVQVRADNTRVVGGSVTGTNGPGVAVTASVSVPPTIEGVSIRDLWPSGNAVVALSAITMRDVEIRDCAWTNVILHSNSTVTGGSISAGHPTGFEFRGSNNSVTGVLLGESVTTPFVEAEGVSGNQFSASADRPALLAAPTCTALPVITGTVAVKSEVTATAGSWSRDSFKFTWTWLRDGVPIANAVDRTFPRYVVSSADIGTQLSVQVTARRTGYEPGRATSARTARIGNSGTIASTQAPKVTGTAQTGKYLYVSRGEWSPYPTSVSFQWLANGTAISGATGGSYQVKASNAGQTITVRVTAVKAGFSNGVVETAGVSVQPTTLSTTKAPVLSGTAQAGKFLYVSKGEWTPYPDSISFQWTVGGSPVSGATGASFQVRSADKGKSVTAVVTAKRAGYLDGKHSPPGATIS